MQANKKERRRAAHLLNLGQQLQTSGKLDQAAATYRQAATLDPGSDAAHRRLGDTLRQQGRGDAAAVSYARSLSIKPDAPETINSLGTLLYEAGRLEQAIVFYHKAIGLRTDYAEAHNNLGLALHHLGRLPEAIASFTRAIRFKPALAAALCNLGAALVDSGDLNQAIESLRRALDLQPSLAEAHLNLGNAYKAQGLLTQAAATFENAILHAPNPAAALNNLAETYKDQGKLQLALEAYQAAVAARPNSATAYSNLLYFYAFTRHISPEEEKLQAQAWESHVLTDDERAAARKRGSRDTGAFAAQPRQGRQMRVGIVSAELGSHAVAQFLQPWLVQLDRRHFHLTLFPTRSRLCARAQGFKDLADSYIPLTELSDSAAADRIRAERIDVLMDTTGHTFGNRLAIFAHRAAPVQCTYLGYWSTTGLTEMDWFFAGPHFPVSMQTHFTERIWRFSRHSTCYQGEHSLPESVWAPDPSGTIWLGSLNRLSKIREQTLGLWAKVLHALPKAKLLFEDGAAHEVETHQRILSALSSQGIAEDRVTFIPFFAGHERHMALYDRLDIALDTIPFNSGTTAYDALWMGAPLVALEGDWLGGTMASSVLRAFDRPEWVALDEAEYVSIVCRLAQDIDGRTQQRKRQRARMIHSPLCDAKDMARSIERAFEAMYDQWMAGLGDQPASSTMLTQISAAQTECAPWVQSGSLAKQ
jgi:protein O-GlcNAc transferase